MLLSKSIFSLSVLFLLLGSITLFAQSKNIHGNVIDQHNASLIGANIVVYDSNHNMINYSTTDKNGNYTISFKQDNTMYIKVSFIGYAEQELLLSTLIKENKDNINFTLIEDNNLLDEVVIKPEDKQQDTVSVNLRDLNITEESKLNEILKKSPGFQISDGGIIMYKGKNIEKIKINGKEAFVNQNDLALQNIENRMIESINVINVHKDKFALDFDDTNEAVLNIDTKKQYKDIVTGSERGGLGYKNKFDSAAKLFYFNNFINSFANSNINNVGNSVLELREIKSITRIDRNSSDAQVETLSRLFEKNENRSKDFQSNNNLTLRYESGKARVAVLNYLVNNNFVNDITTISTDLSGLPILNSNDRIEAKSNAYLANANIDFRIDESKIIVGSLNFNHARNTSNKNSVNQLFPSSSVNLLNSLNHNDDTSIESKIIFNKKINSKAIVGINASSFFESSIIDNSSNNDYTNQNVLLSQLINYDKNHLFFGSQLKYKYHKSFLPSFEMNFSRILENTTESLNKKEVSRTVNEINSKLSISGSLFNDKIVYKGKYELNLYKIDLYKFNSYLPYEVSINYENRLNRFFFFAERLRTLNSLNAAFNTVKNYSQVVEGNSFFQKTSNFTDDINIGYAYVNLFTGKSIGLTAKYQKISSLLRQGFLYIDNSSISHFALYEIPKSYELRVSGNASTIAFKSRFPIKSDLNIIYSNDNYPTIIDGGQLSDVLNRQYVINTDFETLAKGVVNIQSSFNFTSSDIHTANSNFNYISFGSINSFLYDNHKLIFKLSFLYNKNYIMDDYYTRKNFNFSAAYRLRRLTLGMDSKNLGDIFGFFDNSAYNTRFVLNQGINTAIITNRALNYCIFYGKYNF